MEIELFDLRERHFCQHRLEETGYETVVDVEITETRIVYEVIVVNL